MVEMKWSQATRRTGPCSLVANLHGGDVQIRALDSHHAVIEMDIAAALG